MLRKCNQQQMVQSKFYCMKLLLQLAVCATLYQVASTSFVSQTKRVAEAQHQNHRSGFQGKADTVWQAINYGMLDSNQIEQDVPWRSLLQTGPTQQFDTLGNISLQEGYDGKLLPVQQLELYQQYHDWLSSRVGPMTLMNCADAANNKGDLRNVIIRDCHTGEYDLVVFQESSATIENVIFFNNSGPAPVGVLDGASVDFINVVFLSNNGWIASGILVRNGSQISADHLVMHGHAQRPVGARRPQSSIRLLDSCLTTLAWSTFVGNGWSANGDESMSPSQGSAIYLSGQLGDDNVLGLINAPICTMLAENNTFMSNIASQDGGALYLDGLKVLQMGDNDGNVFSNNQATNGFGGAVYVGQSFFVSINFNNIITNNRARQGGALNVQASRIIMAYNNFTNNSAFIGGALQLFGTEATLQSSTFANNTATSLGGAVNAAKFSDFTITDSWFESNSADTGGAAAVDAYHSVWVGTSYFLSNHAAWNSTDATQCSADHPGGGGALCINTVPAGRSDTYGIEVVNCTFQENSATNGGALLFPTLCQSNDTSCAEMALGFFGNGTFLSDNAAVGGLGDLLWTAEPGNLMSNCNTSTDTTGFCTEWISPSTTQGMNIKQRAASSAGMLMVGTGNTSLNFNQTDNLLHNLVSSAVTPMPLHVSVLLMDDFGIPTTSGSADANATITLKSDDAEVNFIGSPIVAARGGVAVFDDLAVKAPAGTYTLTFNTISAAGRVLKTPITITVRDCRVGEVKAAIDECTACRDANQYSFNPVRMNSSCDICPPNARCGYDGKNNEKPPDGPIGAVLVPLPGYWQSSPRSPQIHQCPFPNACTGSVNDSDTQRTALADYQKQLVLNEPTSQNSTMYNVWQEVSEYNLTEYNTLQCREGQYGNVCAGCLSGFGRRTEGECVKCPKRALNSFILFLAVLIRIVMVGLTISSQLQAFKDEYNECEASGKPEPVKDPELLISNTVLSHESRPAVGGKSMKALTVEQRVERCFGSDTTAVKILINYLQITAILKGVTIELPAPVLRLLSTAGVVSSGIQSWISIDCSMFDTSTPKSIQATVVSVVIPLCILVFTVPFWVQWWRTHIKVKPNAVALRPYLESRMRITALALAFYFYPQLVDSILSIFSCKQLDLPANAEDTPYVLLTAVGKWWTSDYNLQCYKGQHLVLMLALGIPGILIICAGIPLWSALFLRANKKYHKEVHFAATYALMYTDYEDRFFYWESLVMVRKFVLVLLAVSIGSSNPVLKLLACLVWIEASTIVVVAAKPYRLRRMDRLERVSHWGNAFTVMLLAMFFIDSTNEGLKVFCTVTLILGNAAVIVYMVIQIFRESLYSLMMELDAEARGMLKSSDLWSTPSTDSMTRLKMNAVERLLSFIFKLPPGVARWLVIYPCEQTESLEGQAVCIIKQAAVPVSDKEAAVSNDATVETVHVSNIQLPTKMPAPQSVPPGPLRRQAPDWTENNNTVSTLTEPTPWQHVSYV